MRLLSIPLLPLAGIYAAATALRNLGYDRGWRTVARLPVPVVSIGNITVGGTGKTPMAEFLLQRLLDMQLRPAYLSRGYGRATRGYLRVDPADPRGAAAFGDEAFQVAHRFAHVPVAVCEDRVAGAQRLLESHAIDVLVLDDAFQHRRIGRDLDWVMVDCSRPPLPDWPLPAGRLREPLRGLRRADTIVLTKFEGRAAAERERAALQAAFPKAHIAAMEMQPRALHPFDQGRPSLPAGALQGMPVVAFSGIGNNGHFVETLRGLGADLRQHIGFADHHAYGAADLEKISQAFASQKEIKDKLPPALILTTEKDYYRLKAAPWMQRFAHLPLTYLAVGMVPLFGWEMMETKIKNCL